MLTVKGKSIIAQERLKCSIFRFDMKLERQGVMSALLVITKGSGMLSKTQLSTFQRGAAARGSAPASTVTALLPWQYLPHSLISSKPLGLLQGNDSAALMDGLVAVVLINLKIYWCNSGLSDTRWQKTPLKSVSGFCFTVSTHVL